MWPTASVVGVEDSEVDCLFLSRDFCFFVESRHTVSASSTSGTHTGGVK